MVPAGKHRGRVIESELRKAKKEDAHPYVFLRFAVGQESVDFFGSFSPKVIEQGKRKGQRVGDLTAETLVNLGWEGDFNKFSELLGAETEIVVEHEPDQEGRPYAKVRFINTPMSSGTPVEAGDVAGLAKSFRAVVVEAKKKRPASMPKRATASASGASEPAGGNEYDDYADRGAEPF